MQLLSDDGAVVELSLHGYQFPSLPGGNPRADIAHWDANWLVVDGAVRTANGQSWTFSEPCLTTWEAAALLRFLQRTSAGDDSTVAAGAGARRTLEFVEPDVAFEELEQAGSDPRTIEVRLSHGCAPPVDRQQSGTVVAPDVRIPIRMDSVSWQSAAQAWATELAAYPRR